MYGHGLFSPFFAPWVLKLALENSAIVMSPDHRLLPSKNVVADVIQDLEDVWKWMRSDLHIVLGKHVPGISIDLSHTLITGGSAGGYGEIQLALSHPNEISAVAIAYPLVDPKDDLMTGGPSPGEPTILRFPLADIPKKESIISWIEEARKTVVSKAELERTPYAVGAAQYGLFDSMVFDSRPLNSHEFLPMERIKSGAKLPKNM